MRSTVDVQKVARIDSEAVIVPKINVGAGNVHALQLTGNAIQMFAEIVGSVVVMELLACPVKEVIIMNVGT